MEDSLLFISHGSPHKAIKEQFSEIYVSIQRAIGQQWISFHERDGLALPAEQKRLANRPPLIQTINVMAAIRGLKSTGSVIP
jgi:hypothetical protein